MVTNNTKSKKFRNVVVMLTAAFVFGVAATSAFALTADQKVANQADCMKAGGSFKACCIGAGGTWSKAPSGAELCHFTSDLSSSGTSLGVRPPAYVGTLAGTSGGQSQGGVTTSVVGGVLASGAASAG